MEQISSRSTENLILRRIRMFLYIWNCLISDAFRHNGERLKIGRMWTEREGQLTAERSILTDINRAEIFVVRITRVGCCIVAAVTRLQTSELFMAPKETVPGSSGLHVTKMLSQIEIRSCHLRGLCRKSGARTHIRRNWCYPTRASSSISWSSFDERRNIND